MTTTPTTTQQTTIYNVAAKDCGVCQQPFLQTKAGPGCKSCPAYDNTHYFPFGSGPNGCDVVIIGDVPSFERLQKLTKSTSMGFYHGAFEDDAGRVVRSAVHNVQKNKLFSSLTVKYLYAVKCGVENPNKEVITSCKTPLLEELSRIVNERVNLKSKTKLTILACGVTALRSLGISVHSFDDAAGRTYETKIGDIAVSVVVTMSLKAIAAQTGKYSSLLADVERAFRLSTETVIKTKNKNELEQGYRYPKTVEEVRELVDEIIAYSGHLEVSPNNWGISLDTETNTLHPHRDGTALLMLSVSWDKGKAAAIPLWHPLLYVPYEEEVLDVNEQGQTVKKIKTTVPWVTPDYCPDKAWEEVKRLLSCNKPKILHNAGFDLKVIWHYKYDIHNIQWDCMLFEHVLEEDKKGQYSLKYLTKQYHPEYSGYEDKLREILEKDEGDDQNKSIEKQTQLKEKILDIPKKVLDALQRLNLTIKFQPHALKKKLNVWKNTPEKYINEIADAELVITAKEKGEFKAPKAVKEAKKEKEGGFQNIPLGILSFYAAVDADVTRQLAVSQRQRMSKEQQETVRCRLEVQKDLSYRRFQSETAKVNVLCPEKEPLVTLAKNKYIPRMRRLAEVEYRGIKVDREYLKIAHDALDKAIFTTEQQIHKMAGVSFNINSGPQVAKYLNDTGIGHIPKNVELAESKAAEYPDHVFWDKKRLSYKALSKTKTGQIQTTEAVLKAYVQQYDCEFSNLILAYKKASKAKNTFLKNVDSLSSLDGFLHTRYNINGTGTGRLSSSNMNMQNVPKGQLGGVICKKLFIPDDDNCVFVNADAKGAEISIFAGYSKDASLISALKDGMDAHCFFSSKILNPTVIGGNLVGEKRRLALLHAGIDDDHAWSYEDFFKGKDGLLPDKAYCKRLKALRDNIKRVVFGILFGAGPRKIAEIAGINFEFAKTIISFLFELFKTIPNFVELTKWELRTFGFVETYHGRRRRYPIKNAPTKLMAQMERRAVNFKIQGTNSDIVLDVLCAVADVIERDFRGRVLLTVHDSIGFQIPKIYLSQVPDLFKEYGTRRVSQQNPWLPVDYKWDITCGPSYGEQVSIEEYLEKNKQEIDRLLQINQALFEGYTEEEMYTDLREAVLEASD